MTIVFADSSALVSSFLDDESGHRFARTTLERADAIAISRITPIECRRAFRVARESRAAALEVIEVFDGLLHGMSIIDVDHGVCALADAVSSETGLRTLDAIQVASALRIVGQDVAVLTLDVKQAASARLMGLNVIDE
jgi:predicted nucleic acid-binding protein